MFYIMIKICEVCGIEFHIKPSHFNKRKCCSKNCQNINQKNKIGSLNNNWKGGVRERICEYCKNKFIPNNPYSKRRFCSHKCSTNSNIGKEHYPFEALKKLQEIYKIPNIKKICSCGNVKDPKSKHCKKCWLDKIKNKKKYVKCIHCNNEFHLKYQNKKYCSRKCFKEHRSIINKGKGNPNWQGGLMTKHQMIRASDEYKEWRNKVFIRDNYTCQHCEQKGGNLHSHHIKPFASNPKLRTEPSNGLTLCKKCHNKVHINNKRPITID